MENHVEQNFVWKINNLTFSQPKRSVSDTFLIAGNLWRLLADVSGSSYEFYYENLGYSEGYQSLTSTWRRHVKLRLTIVNAISQNRSLVTDTDIVLDENHPVFTYPTVSPPSNLLAKDVGFLVDGVLTIVVKVVALDVIHKSENVNTMYVNGVSSSSFTGNRLEIESVKRIFRSYPDIASNVRVKNQCLRTTYMNVLLGTIATLRQLPRELSDNDLDEASFAVTYLAKVGFKVNWLEKKLEEVKEKKKKVETCNDQIKRMKQDFLKLNQQCLELKDRIEKEKAVELASNVPLSFNDVF